MPPEPIPVRQCVNDTLKVNQNTCTAVEKLIEEADKIAEAASVNHVDITNELFNDKETELDFWDNSVDDEVWDDS